jgi:uncharacterized membrane protein
LRREGDEKMVRIENSIEINAEPEKIFKILNDVEQRPKWDRSVKNCSIISEQKTGPGTKIHYISSGIKKIQHDEIISEYEENKKLESRVDEGEWTGHESIQLEKTTAGTKLNVVIDYEIPSSYGTITNRLKNSEKISENMMKSLKNLKEFIEQE